VGKKLGSSDRLLSFLRVFVAREEEEEEATPTPHPPIGR
jgi:hypothetical protein